MREDCLLDVLAAAQAARLSGERFCFGAEPHFPALTEAQARQALDSADDAEVALLADHPLDLLRGSGQLGSLADRVRELLQHPYAVSEIVAWRLPMEQAVRRKGDMAGVSLRWESRHPSDVPAAQRWGGSRPVPRLSHPGRNLLAALTVAQVAVAPAIWLDLPYGTYPEHPAINPFTVGRRWWAPRQPCSYAYWRAMILAGPEPGDSPAVAAEWDERGAWWTSRIERNGKYFTLRSPTARRWSAEYANQDGP